MASILARGGRLYAKFRDARGKMGRVRTDFVVGQESAARKWAASEERLCAAEHDRRAGRPVEPEALTLNAWVATWAEKRVKLGLEANHDHARLRNHVLPTLGERPIKSIEPKHVVDLFDAILSSEGGYRKHLPCATVRRGASICTGLRAAAMR